MKNRIKRVIPAVLGTALLLTGTGFANAAFSDFQDVQAHWANATLQNAYNDGIMKGYSNTEMAPNDSITTAQAVTILCRVLGVSGSADISAYPELDGNWYKEDAARALYCGLITPEDIINLNNPINRGDAFCLFTKAFHVMKAVPDYTVLDQFKDAQYLSGELKQATASLVQLGVVNGNEGNLLIYDSLTRAEFVTLLYRLVNTFGSVDSCTGGFENAYMLSGNGNLSDLDCGNLWFNETAKDISLNNITAGDVTVCADGLNSMSITGETTIHQLILASRGKDVSLKLADSVNIGSLVVADGTGTVSYSGNLSALDVTGSNRTVNLNNPVETISISGDNNTIVIKNGCKVGAILVTGTNNNIKLGGAVDEVTLSAPDNSVSGGKITTLTLNTKKYNVTSSVSKTVKWANADLSGTKLTLDAPDTLPAGAVLEAAVNLEVEDKDYGKLCTGTFYVNDEAMEEIPVLLGVSNPVSDIMLFYDHNLQQNGTVSFVLTYENSDGETYTLKDSDSIYLETFADLGLADAEVEVAVPDTLPVGQTLTATATVTSPETGKTCTGTWYVDGKEVATDTYVLGGQPSVLKYNYDYHYGMPEESEVSYKVAYTTADGRYQDIQTAKTVKVENYADNGIAGAYVTMNAPTWIAAGQTFNATAPISYLEAGKVCTAQWYVDGALVSTQRVTLGSETPSLSYNYKYTEKMNTNSVVRCDVSYTTPDGRNQMITCSGNVTLQNYDFMNYHGNDASTIFSMVTNTYAGNYTLKWAQEHDYTRDVKTAWVNLKGYSSKTQYLVWVNLTYQRVNIFEGSQGNWKLIHEFLCGSGKASTPTIKGVFTTSYKQPLWSYGSYYCGPIVRFNGSSGYAFHSRLEYFPMNSDRYYDASIGYPISHGCLRMYNNDIWWMYNNIPNGTTVVVH